MSAAKKTNEQLIDDLARLRHRVAELEKAEEEREEDVINKLASEIYSVDEPPYLEIYAEVAKTGKPARFETYFPPMDKLFSISVFSPRKGQFATVFEDITERKRAREALGKSEGGYGGDQIGGRARRRADQPTARLFTQAGYFPQGDPPQRDSRMFPKNAAPNHR